MVLTWFSGPTNQRRRCSRHITESGSVPNRKGKLGRDGQIDRSASKDRETACKDAGRFAFERCARRGPRRKAGPISMR
jgi:hypothetical protein